MKNIKTNQIRNVALVSHGGVGKTTLAEAFIYNTGLLDRLGRVDDGNTVSDFNPDEVKRKISINSSLLPFFWKDCKINLIDTPGFMDFIGEVASSLHVVDNALVLVSATAGVEVGTEVIWQDIKQKNLPAAVVINRMDKENADFYKALKSTQDMLGKHVIPIQLPIGKEDNFNGIVNLMTMEAFHYEKGGQKPVKIEIPADLKSDAEAYHSSLVEKIAETDDELLTKFLEEETLSPEELKKGLAEGIKKGLLIPVLCASAYKNIGVFEVMDLLAQYMTAPDYKGTFTDTDGKEHAIKEDGPTSLLVFKTTADPYIGKLTCFKVYTGTLRPDIQIFNTNKNRDEKIGPIFMLRGKQQENMSEIIAGDIGAVAKLQETVTGDTLCDKELAIKIPPPIFPQPVISMAIVAKTKNDEDKLGNALARILEEDPTVTLHRDTTTKQTILSGLGELHLDVMVERLKRKFNVNVTLQEPKIPYKETIRSKVQSEGKHKKQSGGRGQYGHVWLEIEPHKEKEYEFIDRIVGGVVPKNYIPSVEKGVKEVMEEGVLAGYPLTNIKITLYDGSYHTVDSSDIAFKLAGVIGLRQGALKANPALLEPIMSVEVRVPDTFMGDVIADLNSKRGKIHGMEPDDKLQVIKASVPMAEMLRYAIDLRSITQGRGLFKMTLSHYEEVPPSISEKVIEEVKREKEEAKV